MTRERPAGIATMYRGTEYRSRLEARWASFFYRIGWQFTYEPFDGNGYIPDFVIHGPRPLAVEVKPAATIAEFTAPVDKITTGLEGVWNNDILIVGLTPISALGADYGWSDRPSPGLLGERWKWDGEGENAQWIFDCARWMRCLNCRQVAVFHDLQTYVGRPCGCYQGDHYLGQIESTMLGLLWNHAGNDVKWRGRNA